MFWNPRKGGELGVGVGDMVVEDKKLSFCCVLGTFTYVLRHSAM